jgi:Protein of unknown function (DUF2911)
MLTRLSFTFALLFVCSSLLAQQAPSQGETTCTFDDGKQVTVRYPQIAFDKKSELPDGQPWPSENTPIYLFSQADITIGSTTVPAGAYGIYTVPGKKDSWDLVVTRDVTKDGKYDSSKDVGKVPMQTGELPSAANRFVAYFGHVAPKTCALRLDYGKTRGFTDFKEK